MTKPNQKKRKRPGKGALSLIAVLFLLSALIRVGPDAGAALAGSGLLKTGDKPALPEEPPKARASDAELQVVLTAFQERDARLAEREAQLEMRSQALTVADREIERKMTALLNAEDKLRETMAYADTAAEGDLARLTAVYENMKPKDAAALFEEMDPDFAAGFLGRMRADSAAGIMAGLSPPVAYSVSILLAGRNANVPKQ
jgi:flagellar motility protein MotE (MotC chaperone)